MENIKQLLVQLELAGIRLFLQDGALKSKAKKGAITPEIAKQIKQHKSAIIEALTHYSDAPQVNPVTRREDLSHYPVSFAQQRLYTLDQIQGGSAEYHMPMVFRLSGQLDVALIERVFREIVSRHEVLRAVFRQSTQGVQQSLLDPQDFTVERSHLTSQDEASGIERFVRESAEQPFNLAEDFMLRVRFATLPAGDAGVLFINMHHIATDGWSMDILLREFFALFHAFGYGQPNPLPELSIQYADYAQWQRDWLQGEVLDTQLSYWQQQLAELPRVHALGLDYPRPEVKTYQGEVVSQTLSAQLCQQLAAVARRYGLTPFMLIHGALALVLSRNSNHHDIVIGTPVANRRQVELESLIGFFVNTLILRVNTQAQPLGDYLAQLRQVHLDAQSHQDLPFEKLVEVLKVPRSTAHSPLFQIMLTTNSEYGVRDTHADTTELAGLSISPLQGNGATTKFDLDINASVSDDGGAIEWTYDVALFTRERIEILAQHLNNTLAFLAQLNADSTLSTAAIPMLTDAEIAQLSAFNDNAIEYPQQRCIHELFEAQAEQTPERIAVQCGDVAVSYGELNARANQLAHYLRFEHHIAPDCPVGICLERGVEMIIAMLAILKAGGAYVPLDPAYPEERLAYLIEDASLKVVLTQQTLTGTVSLPGTQRVMLDDLIAQPGCAFSHYSTANIGRCESGVTEQHLAYLIYTSGSTGKPKGVMIEHRNTVAMLYWARAAFNDQALRRVLASTSLNFDLSVYEIFLPLSFGFEVVVVKNALALADQPLDISLINTVPSAMKALLDVGALPASLTTVNLAGEPLTAQQVNQIFAALPEAEVCNLYGPSEDTTYSTCARFSTLLESVPDIGYVIANSQAYVLGDAMERLPIGCVGELYLGGAGVACGYLNRPELTEERFIANPYYEAYSTDCSPRLYRTGDLVRYRQDGRLEFIGRSDDQVKIRGFRIELGEIEHRLNQLEDVALSQVLARTLADGQQQLVAYVQPCITCETTQDETQQAAWISDIKLRLGQQLPAHMVPGLFVVMPQWPLTPNGKIDKKALPAPDALQQSSAQYVAPETELAQLLASLWADLLGLEQDKISATANFFELGGHSLLIMQLLAKLQQHNLSCSAQQLFQAVDLAAMAEVISEADDAFAIPENKIPPQCDAITPDMLTLATLEQSEIDAIAAATSGGMRNIQDIYPLAPLQEGVLFVHTLNPEHDPYVTTASFEFTSAGKLSGFVTQLNWLIQRHDVLRTAIFWRGRQQAMQVVMREARLPVTELTLREGNIEAQFTEYVASGPHGFDLESAPLIQLVVTPEDELGRVFAMLKFHHLITDHVSLEILMSELEADNVLALPAPLPYREFIARSMAQSAELDTEAFFTEQLGDIDTPTLPFDLAQVTGDGNSVVEYHSTLSDTQSQLIRTLCKRHQCSPAALFHLAWAQVLSACCGRDEVVFGTVMSGRMNGMAGIERMMGMLINTLPLRLSLGHQAAHVALKEVNDALQALLPYEQVSLAEAQSYSGIDGNTPLFSAIVNYRHSATQSEPAGEQDTSPGVALLSTRERTNYPFDLSVNDLGEGDSFSLDYQIEQSVSAARIAELMHTALDALVEALNEHSEQPVATLAVLSEPELTQLSQGQSDEASYPRNACIHEVFELHASATPDSIALQLNKQTLSYDELNAKANQLARYLREVHQVGSGTLVGLCIGRSVEMIVASLAILKAGGAYVPLDPNYPQSRLAYMLEDTQLSVILTERAQQETLAFSQVTKLILDDADTPWSALSKDNLTRADALTPQSLAYVIYTSGSTGTPKGVMTPHRAVNRLVHAPNFMTLDSQTVFLQSANIAFDAATLEIWGPLLNGGRCVLYPDSLITLDGLNRVLRTQEITALWLTSGLFTEWSKVCNELAADTLALQNVLAGGDVLNPQAVATVQRALPEVTVINGYGPTENTTFTCCYPVPQHSDIRAGVPIGSAVQGDQLLILTPHGRRVPQGVVGELCVGGDGLALGYLNQPALSKERFIRNPYQTQGNQPEILYRTGDLVRCNTDGLIEYAGRVDDQIKIRGFRVELGEIERQLDALDDVAAALVTIKTRTGGDKQLVAYVELNCDGKQEEQGAHIQGLVQALAAQLPAYMIPAAFVLVQDWPLTPNGKIDRNALPEADFSLMQAEYVAPVSELETQLVALWSELLDLPVEQISTQANFFELGGHSLLVMKLLQALNQHLEIELQIADLYRCENIQQIAGFIESVQAIHDQTLPAQQDNNEFEDFEL
ncbi:non-ribosomal peptide synthetase [Pseudoalteromonas rubra]|uniref:Non-ribosomal peptide synthetase n=1 Tax=Pseudoalteromonas rubra TaxID=43658 RepID=A0A5S3WPS9_9GAMM|nr:non-ribosomal peptide synthetase [Pseudoalteromonas rubra]TMP30778.1 non-ribosomal peptide synthetase [Pseudoalteromonas rubra]TMP34146.1 non-ribosomal peptide synthetase [Pseudoalteromonas rubra]